MKGTHEVVKTLNVPLSILNWLGFAYLEANDLSN